jgi:hypothetical protein
MTSNFAKAGIRNSADLKDPIIVMLYARGGETDDHQGMYAQVAKYLGLTPAQKAVRHATGAFAYQNAVLTAVHGLKQDGLVVYAGGKGRKSPWVLTEEGVAAAELAMDALEEAYGDRLFEAARLIDAEAAARGDSTLAAIADMVDAINRQHVIAEFGA